MLESKMKKNNDYQQHANDLVNTSVQDMQSSLSLYSGAEPYHTEIIRRAIVIAKRRNEATKLKVLQAKLKKMQKEAGG
jgi:hypothetical protein